MSVVRGPVGVLVLDTGAALPEPVSVVEAPPVEGLSSTAKPHLEPVEGLSSTATPHLELVEGLRITPTPHREPEDYAAPLELMEGAGASPWWTLYRQQQNRPLSQTSWGTFLPWSWSSYHRRGSTASSPGGEGGCW